MTREKLKKVEYVRRYVLLCLILLYVLVVAVMLTAGLMSNNWGYLILSLILLYVFPAFISFVSIGSAIWCRIASRRVPNFFNPTELLTHAVSAAVSVFCILLYVISIALKGSLFALYVPMLIALAVLLVLTVVRKVSRRKEFRKK